MPDMHGSGRIGAHVLDIDRSAPASRARAVPVALNEDGSKNLLVNLRLQNDIDEPRPGDLDLEHARRAREIGGQGLSEGARSGAGRLYLTRVDHGGVGRKIAMRGVARRLDDEAVEIEIARQFAGGGPLFEHRRNVRLEIRKNVHSFVKLAEGARV